MVIEALHKHAATVSGRGNPNRSRCRLKKCAKESGHYRRICDCENLKWPGAYSAVEGSTQSEVIPETIDLMHALVQDCNDANVAIRQTAPVDEVAFIAKEVPIDA